MPLASGFIKAANLMLSLSNHRGCILEKTISVLDKTISVLEKTISVMLTIVRNVVEDVEIVTAIFLILAIIATM